MKSVVPRETRVEPAPHPRTGPFGRFARLVLALVAAAAPWKATSYEKNITGETTFLWLPGRCRTAGTSAATT